MKGDLTWGGEHIIQYSDNVLQNCTPETYIILLTNVTPVNSIGKRKKLSRCIHNEGLRATDLDFSIELIPFYGNVELITF